MLALVVMSLVTHVVGYWLAQLLSCPRLLTQLYQATSSHISSSHVSAQTSLLGFELGLVI